MKHVKNTIATITAILLIFSNGIVATASLPDKIVTAILPIDFNYTLPDGNIKPATVSTFPLTADMFIWSSGQGAAGAPVTRTQLRNANISVKYTCSHPKVLKEVALADTTFGGVKTACVQVKFAEEYASVNPQDFRLTLYFTIGGKKNEASVTVIDGTFENEEETVGSGDDHINAGGGQVFQVEDYIANIEIDLGEGVQVFTSLQSGRKYYAKAKNRLMDADDRMLSKYPDIITAVRISTVNLKFSGNCVSLKDIGPYQVYSSSGKHLGSTDDRLPFHELYYLTTKKISMSSAGTSQGSQGGGKAAADTGDVGLISGNTPQEKKAGNEMAAAAKTAAVTGSGIARMHMKNRESITAGELEAMFAAASKAKLKATFINDTMTGDGKNVQGRIIINPAMAVKLDKTILLGVYTSELETRKTKTLFEGRYSNHLRVVALAHQGGYGMSVAIAARINTKDFDTTNLYFYCYDPEANRIEKIVKPKFSIDKYGYLHFNTLRGGDIIISDGPLMKRR